MSKADASEVQPGAGLGESKVLAPRAIRHQAADEVRGAVAGAAGQLRQQPQLGLRGALTDQKASHAVGGNADDIFFAVEESATRCTDVDRQPKACPAVRGLPTQSQSHCSQPNRGSTGLFAPLLFLPRSPLPCQTHCSIPR